METEGFSETPSVENDGAVVCPFEEILFRLRAFWDTTYDRVTNTKVLDDPEMWQP